VTDEPHTPQGSSPDPAPAERAAAARTASDPAEETSRPTSEQHPAPPPAPSEPRSAKVNSQARRFDMRLIGRIVLVCGTLLLIGWLLWNSWSALLPFQIGIVIAYLILPLVNWLSRYVPRTLAVLLVYLGGLVVVINAFAVVVPLLVDQTNAVLDEVPSIEELQTQAAELLTVYEENVPPQIKEPINEAITDILENARTNFISYAQEGGSFLLTSALNVINTVTFVVGFVIVPFWIFFVVKDQPLGIVATNKLLPPSARPDFWAIVGIIDRVLSSYIRGQLLLGLVVGAAAWIGLTVLDLAGFEVRYVVLLAVIAGFTELIPIVGPVLGAIPAIIMGLFDSVTAALAIAALYVLIQQMENHLLVPRIVGESVGIHPAILMILLVVASQVWGLIGLILAAPLAAVARDVYVYVYGRLSDPPAPAGILADGTDVMALMSARSQADSKQPAHAVQAKQPPEQPPA
jgi:predicted PurR-regulated permease PerM